ncbi:hypothetical protein B0T18DRAFT_431860 [Schizothecium vesticola]|uniref:Uncharacterized protein n=1 Tax=Schizothecium vesticola TaxID=314040 RepID=A0AA40JZF0_9PEZI|nr:hypothetical protein B0T18DRAFT_431860 [Schizothecium vesticola]
MPPKPPPLTHFLAIPLLTSASRPHLAAKLAAFRADPAVRDAIPPDAIRPLGTLHLTLGVFSFPPAAASAEGGEEEPGPQRLARACELLKTLPLRDIWRAAGRVAAGRPAGEERADEEDTPVGVTLRGLRSMTPGREEASGVLYAPVEDVHTLLAKDSRIAALERELALAESEFARELDARARSETALRAQVQGLKAWVSASTRATPGAEAATDEEVGMRVAGVGNEVQTADEELMRRWRAQTMGILRRASGRDSAMLRETERVTAEVVATVNGILEEMTVPPIPPSEARDQGLAVVVAAAVDLARLLAVQRAQFTVVFPELLPYQRTVTAEDLLLAGNGSAGGETKN